MEKIKPRLYQLTIALSLISLILALVSSGKQREFFSILLFTSVLLALLSNIKKSLCDLLL